MMSNSFLHKGSEIIRSLGTSITKLLFSLLLGKKREYKIYLKFSLQLALGPLKG